MTKLKIGFALGGGAARGWAHIGVIRALAEMEIKPDIIAGTSIGALVGAVYAVERLDELEDWVRKLRRRDVAALLDINLFAGGLIEGDKLMNTFRHYFDAQKIQNLSMPFGAIATDLANGNEVWFQEGNLWDAIRASIAVPGLFSPWHYRERWLADGGLVNPVPISLCRALGADQVIAINLNSNLISKHFDLVNHKNPPKNAREALQKDPEEGSSVRDWFEGIKARISGSDEDDRPGIVDVLSSSLYIMQERITRSRMAGDPANVLLNPHLESIGMMEFDRAREAIDEGYAAVQRMRDDIERNILLH
ncbi:MAG: patatin-like phospholipase RssA [Gammaproteobacteria bacterium]